MFKILKLIVIVVAALGAIIFISATYRQSSDTGINSESKISTPVLSPRTSSPLEISPEVGQKISTTTKNVIQAVTPKPKSISSTLPSIKSTTETIAVKAVSSKSFEELINSSMIQLYCGDLSADETSFSEISRGTGIIIDDDGKLLTNRHVIYNENLKKIKNNCFVLKSHFPNLDSQKPKIYYKADIINYPLLEKFNDSFSKDKYYNDFAILKIYSKIDKKSKINLLLGFDYALPEDYLVFSPYGGFPEGGENNDILNFLPIDWEYQPKNNDTLITLGYGIDASHVANKITSTIGKISGNVNISGGLNPQILLIESNATTGFSGGALINPESKGLVGLVSWITAGDVTGKYTVAIFRDFLRNLMIQDLNFDLKLMQNQ